MTNFSLNFLNDFPQLELFLVVFFALIIGSFISLFTYRINSKEPIVFARSKCISCNKALGILNLIPLFSWLFQRGKCSSCKSKISARYPAIEATNLVCYLIIYFFFNQDLTLITILYFLIASTLLVMCVTDLEHYFIPNSSQYFLVILITILLIQQNDINIVSKNLLSGFVYMGFGLAVLLYFYITTKEEAIGVDDIKFFFIIGFGLGLNNFISFMMMSGAFGIIFGLIWQKLTAEDTFPFAPAICSAAFICLVFQDKVDVAKLIEKAIF